MGTPFRRIDPDTRAVIVTDYKYGVTLLEYSGGDLVYIGTHMDQDALTSDDDWIVLKLIYSSGDFVRMEKLTGIYDNRATLGWRT